MTDKYCPRGEIKKLEAELWNLKVKGTDVVHSMVQLHQKVFKSSVYASTTTFLSIFKSSVVKGISPISQTYQFKSYNEKERANTSYPIKAVHNHALDEHVRVLVSSLQFLRLKERFSPLWMFPEESDKIERYVGGLPDMIHGSVVASKPKTMQEAIEMEMN
ncbi:hypothetical protein Tco_1439482 [Tanacetum coccineum]